MLQRFAVLIITGLFSLTAFAQEPQIIVLNFQTWKEQQILEAQNQTLRASARIAQIKAGKASSSRDSSPLPSGSKFKKSEGDGLSSAEKDLRRSQESTKAAADLSLEDYVTVYLPTLRESPDALQVLAQRLSKDELAEIFKVLVRKDSAPDTRRNGSALADALTPSTRSHAP